MNDESTAVFYSSKPRVTHMALNITLAPVLLYLVGIWPWPPTLPHYITFFITGLIGMRYAKQRLGQPRLVLDEVRGGVVDRRAIPVRCLHHDT